MSVAAQETSLAVKVRHFCFKKINTYVVVINT